MSNPYPGQNPLDHRTEHQKMVRDLEVQEALKKHIEAYHTEEFDSDYGRIREMADEIAPQEFSVGKPEPSRLDFASLEFLEKHKDLDFRLLCAIHYIVATPTEGSSRQENVRTAMEYLQRYVNMEGANDAWDRLRTMGMST